MKPSFLSDNRFSEAVPTATSEATGFPVSNILDRRPYTHWMATSTAAQEVQIITPAMGEADTLAIAGHNLAGCTVELQYSTDSGATWKTSVPAFVPANNLAIMRPLGVLYSGVRSGANRSGNAWKLAISGASSVPYIGVLMVGTRLSAARFPRGSFVPELIKAETETAKGKTGHPLGTVVRYLSRDIRADLQYPGQSFADSIQSFYRDNQGFPFFFGWDLDNWPDKCGMFLFAGDVSPIYDALGRVESIPLNLSGVVA